MFYVYIVKSTNYNEIYVGSTNDLRRRFIEHNNGDELSTRRYRPWRLVYYEAFSSEKDAREREMKLKHHGNAIRELKKRIGSSLGLSGTIKDGVGLPSTVKNGAGFTFIEMIVAISIMGIVALIGTGFLLTSLSSSGKAEINKEVRQNGNFALSVMEGLIVSSKNVECRDEAGDPSNKQIWVTDIRGNIAKFICDDLTNYKIASSSSINNVWVSVDLTATNVAVSGCNFTCTTAAGSPTNVGIVFTVSQKTTGLLTPRPNEKSSVSFQTQVSTRNY